jgi:hydroxymethylbilane synthase
VKLRLGTRGSALALTQSRTVARALEALGCEVELVRIRTAGDADTSRPFAEVGAPGVFVRALENALEDERVDLAVHSFKDLPSRSPDALLVAATLPRADPRDRLLVAPHAWAPDAPGLPLVAGARVGTASARRIALLADVRPDVTAEFLRGNVDTRLARLEQGDFDAILLAAAGLDRLAAGGGTRPAPELRTRELDPTVFVPAPSQGAVAVQVRAADAETRAAVARLDDAATRRAVTAERRLLALVEAGCEAPFGAHAVPRATGANGANGPGGPNGPDGALVLHAALERDGRLRRARVAGDDPEALARAAFDVLRADPAETGRGA